MQAKTTLKTRRVQVKQKKEISFPLEKANFLILGLGIAVLIVGYILMSENSVDGFLPTIIAPILLVLGYCVIIPYGILKKPKAAVTESHAVVQETTQTSAPKVSSNIKTK
jgi:hypothetical protein